MALDCASSVQNIGASSCKKLPQLLIGMITTPENYSIAATDLASATALQNAIVAAKGNRVYLWPKWAVGYENISQEEVREETPLQSIPVFPGQYRHRLFFTQNLELYKAMYSHDNSNGRVFLIDHEKKIIGLQGYGLSVTEQVPIVVKPNQHNIEYLQAKREKMGHMIPADQAAN